MESEIRSYESECEDGVQPEQLSTVPESVFEFEWYTYRGALATPSFDLSQSIKVPLGSIGLISLSKLCMSSPPMLDNNMFMTF